MQGHLRECPLSVSGRWESAALPKLRLRDVLRTRQTGISLVLMAISVLPLFNYSLWRARVGGQSRRGCRRAEADTRRIRETFVALNINSFRRLLTQPDSTAQNLWGLGVQTCGLRKKIQKNF